MEEVVDDSLDSEIASSSTVGGGGRRLGGSLLLARLRSRGIAFSAAWRKDGELLVGVKVGVELWAILAMS